MTSKLVNTAAAGLTALGLTFAGVSAASAQDNAAPQTTAENKKETVWDKAEKYCHDHTDTMCVVLSIGENSGIQPVQIDAIKMMIQTHIKKQHGVKSEFFIEPTFGKEALSTIVYGVLDADGNVDVQNTAPKGFDVIKQETAFVADIIKQNIEQQNHNPTPAPAPE